MRLATRLRDWWRGYTDSDVLMVRAKWQDACAENHPGKIIHLTLGEHRALCDGVDAHAPLDGVLYSEVSDPTKW